MYGATRLFLPPGLHAYVHDDGQDAAGRATHLGHGNLPRRTYWNATRQAAFADAHHGKAHCHIVGHVSACRGTRVWPSPDVSLGSNCGGLASGAGDLVGDALSTNDAPYNMINLKIIPSGQPTQQCPMTWSTLWLPARSRTFSAQSGMR